VVTSNVGGLTNVRNLADLGFKTSAVDGSLTLDSASLTKALARDSEALNAIFATSSTGVAAVVADVVSRYTNADDGILVTRQKGINAQVRGLDTQADSMEVRIASFRNTLINQFTAMEKTMAGLRATGSFLSSR
jgi:flagellar hook-associated protein 2